LLCISATCHVKNSAFVRCVSFENTLHGCVSFKQLRMQFAGTDTHERNYMNISLTWTRTKFNRSLESWYRDDAPDGGIIFSVLIKVSRDSTQFHRI